MIELTYYETIGRGTRGHVRQIVDGVLADGVEPFARHIAKIITGKHNQDARILIVGEPGSGKSRTALHLGERIAEEVSKISGGEPATYFNRDSIGVISADDITEKMQVLQRHHIYLLDDAGVAWDSRDFATKMNKNLNHILQTCRTSNACIIITVPDPKLIDIAVTERSLIQYYIEVAESLHEFGKNLVKVFRIKKLYRYKKPLYLSPRYGYRKISMYESGNPHPSTIEWYEEERARSALDAGKKYELQGMKIKAAKQSNIDQRNKDFERVEEIIKEKNIGITKAVAFLNQELAKEGRSYDHQMFRSWRVRKGTV